jgi:enamine deaminase RidA (YjgF/YER057c/UK114 family)
VVQCQPVTTAEARLEQLGIELPAPLPAAGNYLGAKRYGDLVFVSGHGPGFDVDGAQLIRGKVGRDLSVETAREAARLTALHMLRSLRSEVGSLDRVRSVLKVFGMVNCAPGFNQTPAVIDGCSDLLVEVFGDKVGRHARSAVGMAELPFDIPVEIEMVVAVASD